MDKEKNELALLNISNPEFSYKEFASILRNGILEGTLPPAKVGVVIKRMEKISKEVLKDKDVKEAILDDTINYMENGKNAELYGAKITKGSVYTFYDFSECGHDELNELYKIQQFVKDRIKLIEDELKLLISESKAGQLPGLGVNANKKTVVIEGIPELNYKADGNIVEVNPPIKKQTTGLKYRL